MFLFTIVTFFCVYHRDRGQHTLVSPNGEGYLGFTYNHINGLYVAPWHQKKGIGKELMEERFESMQDYIGKGAMVYTYYNTEKMH